MNVYFSGIGGVGIGPLAEIAFDAGYDVQGSDQQASLMTAKLSERGITVNIGQDGNFLEACHEKNPVDWLIYTASLPSDHPELLCAQALGIKTAKRDELLAHIIKERDLKLIAIAGTHGKTTTTGMLIWVLKELGIPVSYSVGSTLSFGPSGKYDPNSEYFVYECDEFDENFLHFSPFLSLITSIDYDHPDTYPTKQNYLDAFAQFGRQSTQLIAWQSQHGELFHDHPNAWLLDQTLTVQIPGEHNRRNATLVIKTIEKLAIQGDAGTILSHFPGTDRRFERLADNLYSDYGHHPVEIAATLQLACELSEHVVLIYQPHQNVRQHEVRDQYTNCFESAEEVYWLPTYLSREDPNLPILPAEALTRNITNRNAVHIVDLNDELWNVIQKSLDEGKLVLCMGAGSIDGWIREHIAVNRVANVLVSTPEGTLVMQQRDNTPGITNPGMITGFGGAVEPGETTREAAIRELHEETNLKFNENELTYHRTIFQPIVNDGTSRWVTYYRLRDQNIDGLEIYEGAGYALVDPSVNLSELNISETAKKAISFI
ncbi:MAG: Mur ligase domain-containing protein [Candidatus Saccharimonadales bacterium]